jgi:cyclophilin family peptidyl-prolyl cis-trans isomerase
MAKSKSTPMLIILLQVVVVVVVLFVVGGGGGGVVHINAFNINIQSPRSATATATATASVLLLSSSSRSTRSNRDVSLLLSSSIVDDDSSNKNGNGINDDDDDDDGISCSRRRWLSQTQQKLGSILAITTTAAAAATTTGVVVIPTEAAYGIDIGVDEPTTTTTTTAGTTSSSSKGVGVVTDKVYVDITGLGSVQSDINSGSAEISKTQRIVFGLFGYDSPNSVKKIKQLFSDKGGLPALCKPLKTDFMIQREQLEANKVYRSCTEGVENNVNVNYNYSQIWRIVKNERIDFGSVSGKFISREFPTWIEESTSSTSTKDAITEYTSQPTTKYLMAVRRGNDSGFGFTVFPCENIMNNKDFIDNYIVIGKVCESTENVVDQINNVSVVSSSKKINYMGVGGGGSSNKKNAPDKSCRYGGPMYCNENKPLQKLTMFRTGIESMDAVLYS